jgi:hypothetical protein
MSSRQRIGYPEQPQHLQRAGLHDQYAGKAEGLRPPLDDPDVTTLAMGLQRQGEPRRAGAGHQDPGTPGHPASARRPQSGSGLTAAPADSPPAEPARSTST